MTDLLRLAARGFGLVTLVAANTVQISHGHYGGALLGGFLISWLWWTNARASGRADDVRGASVAYGAGAALGTVSGMWLTSWWYG